MIFVRSILSIAFGLFIIGIAGSNSVLLWIIGIGFLVLGIVTPTLAIYNENQRKAAIEARKDKWGEETCAVLIAKQIQLDMTQEMVQLSWGKPHNIDQKEVTQKNTKERWVYGQPRKGAIYVWFTNDKVSKIKA